MIPKTVDLPRQTKILDRVQVCVAGGGLAGASAALAAAAAGLSTALVEERGALGWEISHGLEMYLTPGASRPATLQKIIAELEKQNACRDGILDPVASECLLDRLLLAAGVKIHFRAFAGNWDAESGLLRLTTKSGQLAIQAQAVIDATESSRLARASGAAFEEAPCAEKAQFRAFLLCAVQPPTRLETQAIEGFSEVRLRPTLWPGEAHVRIAYKAPPAERAEAESRARIASAIEALRRTKPGFEKASLSLSAHEFFAQPIPQLKRETLPEGLFAAGPAARFRLLPSLEERAGLGEDAAAAAAEHLRCAAIQTRD